MARLSEKLQKVVEASRAAARAFKQDYNEKGEELPDPRPVELPAGFVHPPTIQEQLAMFIRSPQFKAQVANELGVQVDQVESFDEANDFEVDDDEFDDVPTGHEMQEEFLKQARRDADEYVDKARLAVQARRMEEDAKRMPPTAPPVDKSKETPTDPT